MFIIIRQLVETNRASLQEIYLQSRKQTFKWLDTSAYNLMDFDAGTEDEKILVAEYQGIVRGFAALWIPDNFIHHLYVHPLFLNKAIGKTLLNAAVKATSGPPTLKCMANNHNAINFINHRVGAAYPKV